MEDILGREIKIGDIVAFGSSNGGDVSIRIVAGSRKRERSWSPDEILVRGYSRVYHEYDRKLQKWVDVEPYLEMSKGGYTYTNRVVVINESVPDEIKNFLRAGIGHETE